MKEKIMKIGNVILNVYGFMLFFMCIYIAVRRENSIPAVILAMIVCPCSYWFLRKKWGEHRRAIVWLVRGVVAGLGPIALGFVVMAAPYIRCFDFSISSQAKEYFEKHIKTDEIEYKEVSAIQKPEYRDYREVTATVNYEDRKTGQTMQKDVTMYFDRIEGMYFNTFEEMRQYRREHADSFVFELSHFEQKTFNGRVFEVIDYFTENDYEGILSVLGEECKASVTRKKWEEWQGKLSPLGACKQVEDTASTLKVAGDKFHTQAITVVVTVQFAEGTADIKMTLNEELMVTELEV